MVKKKPGIRWGFKWGEVVSGGAMVLGGGGVALLAYLGGVIWFWPIGIAFVGLFILISGLMGEEGVW